jgi:pimeloyl-ACP methyl ester carboxylesterase
MPSPSPTLVNIGTHSLALYAHGPDPPNAKTPIILFVSGVASSSLVWAGITRLLPSSLRSYTYDRSGYGHSEVSPREPTAENIALELSLLVEKAEIQNPIVLVGHSWAGVILREFLVLEGVAEKVAGLVLVDANHETTPLVLDPNDAALQACFTGVDFYTAVGITAGHKLLPEEWTAFQNAESTSKFTTQGALEDTAYAPSFPTLRNKNLHKRQPLLGDKPVYVIGGMRSRDWGGLYKAGMERGNGTEGERRRAREIIETADAKSAGLMEEHLKLSTRGRLVFARESGHFVQLLQPEVVVEGVEWVLDEGRKGS